MSRKSARMGSRCGITLKIIKSHPRRLGHLVRRKRSSFCAFFNKLVGTPQRRICLAAADEQDHRKGDRDAGGWRSGS